MRFLVLLLVLFWMAVLLLRGLLGALRGLISQPQQPPDAKARTADRQDLASRRLVRDPVCGVYVAEGLAVPLRVGSEVVHFCSVACRDKYTATQEKMAANG
jgi:hypothetical protein